MKLIILCFYFVSLSNIIAQDCFTKNWTGNGLDHMNLYIMGVTLNGEDLSPMAQIGVFDGDECVATCEYSAILTNNNYLQVKASADDPTTENLTDGFKEGNAISYRLCINNGTQIITDVVADYSTGSGSFSSGGTAVFTLNANINNTPKIDNAIDDKILNEGFGSTTIELSDVFSDPDGDALTFTTANSDETVVTVGISGTTLTITETGLGSSTITINASDGELSVEDNFSVTVNVATGIIDSNIESKFLKIYPNPSSGLIYIKTNESLKGKATIKITNYSGNVVASKSIIDFMNNQEICMDIKHLQVGVYFISFTNEKHHEVIKVVLKK